MLKMTRKHDFNYTFKANFHIINFDLEGLTTYLGVILNKLLTTAHAKTFSTVPVLFLISKSREDVNNFSKIN